MAQIMLKQFFLMPYWAAGFFPFALCFYQKGWKPNGNYMVKQVNSLSLQQISHRFLFSHTLKFCLMGEVMFQGFNWNHSNVGKRWTQANQKDLPLIWTLMVHQMNSKAKGNIENCVQLHCRDVMQRKKKCRKGTDVPLVAYSRWNYERRLTVVSVTVIQ